MLWFNRRRDFCKRLAIELLKGLINHKTLILTKILKCCLLSSLSNIHLELPERVKSKLLSIYLIYQYLILLGKPLWKLSDIMSHFQYCFSMTPLLPYLSSWLHQKLKEFPSNGLLIFNNIHFWDLFHPSCIIQYKLFLSFLSRKWTINKYHTPLRRFSYSWKHC